MKEGRILVVEDDEPIRDTLKYHLVAAGYDVLEAKDGPTALRTARSGRPDLVVLDLMLPGMSGIEVCRALRRESTIPIVMVTAKDSELDKVVGLELGADDYITKPFSVREVLARIGAVLRRARSEPSEDSPAECEELGNFRIDRAARRVMLDGIDIKLTGREFDLLSFLIARPGRVHSRESLLQHVWGYDFVGDRKTVDVHVRWLREKLVGKVSFEIATVRGAGYRLDREPIVEAASR
ncbi:MAG TPA: response regulator transcription factor [Candidatus Dormibacteraeota bacterium]|nr:response regulator transcription factor [Candidatus Dormibacteraeota bacterium]